MQEQKNFEEELAKRLKTVLSPNAVWGSIRINNGKATITSYTDDKKDQMIFLALAIIQNIPFSLNMDPEEFGKELLRMAREIKKEPQSN